MSRPARFTNDQIITATARLAAAHGPGKLTIAQIAGALGAPTGSIYHRFASRDELLGQVWLQAAESFQDNFFEHLTSDDCHAAGLAAVRQVPHWVRRHPRHARILLLYRREDFLSGSWPAGMAARAKKLRQQTRAEVQIFCNRLFGRSDAVAMSIAGYALAEAPMAAVRRYIEAGKSPPPICDALIEATYLATVELGKTQP